MEDDIEKVCKEFAGKVRQYRELRKWSKGQLASQVGCDISYIGKIERCEKFPNLKMICKIARAFDLSPRHFFPI